MVLNTMKNWLMSTKMVYWLSQHSCDHVLAENLGDNSESCKCSSDLIFFVIVLPYPFDSFFYFLFYSYVIFIVNSLISNTWCMNLVLFLISYVYKSQPSREEYCKQYSDISIYWYWLFSVTKLRIGDVYCMLSNYCNRTRAPLRGFEHTYTILNAITRLINLNIWIWVSILMTNF